MASASWKNLEQIKARLARMPAGVQEAAQAKLKDQVEQLVEALKRAAPKSDLEQHPGQLRDSIEASEARKRVLSWRVVAWARDEKGRLFARYVEFGHTARKSGRYVPAQPFWFSTYRAWRRGMFAAVRQAVRDRIKQDFPK